MAYDPGAIEAALAAAVGEDSALIAELRGAFLDSAARCRDALDGAADAAAWRQAALRLKGLAASFGAERLMVLAGDAAGKPHDTRALRRIDAALARF
ncbi:Hpt domain-containing protein [Sphingomonas sp.]|uniref:Hpt domain-containing protein n=1 Tax=Sphingomonas sp. TaxID=28214 RepID=UPI001D23577E|nr:Hpt domain-containing protein [Sphingomonas sp.]MBX9796148.1 Hpt domain-containing protein [Sphingomonas sp.]